MITTITVQLIVLLPIITLIFSIFAIMLTIAWKRIHCLTLFLSIISLTLSFLSLFLVNKVIPMNISTFFYFNKYSILVMSIILVISFITSIFGYFWLCNSSLYKEEFYLLILFSTIGSMLLSVANNMIAVFITLELSSLPVIGLICYEYVEQNSLKSAMKYMMSSMLGTVLMLFGMSLTYLIVGDLSFSIIKYYLSTSLFHNNVILLCGLGMIFSSLSLKLSVVPFHLWIAEIYEGTPAISLMFLSTVVKIVAFNVFFNFCLQTSLMSHPLIYLIIECMACISMILGNLMAVVENNIKKIISLSSISHISYVLIVLFGIYNNELLIENTIFYLIGYVLNNLCVFSVIFLLSMIYTNCNCNLLHFYKGLFWKSPILALSMTINLMSFIGFPLTIGFIGKLNLLIFAVKENLWYLIISLVIGSIISIYYYMKIVVSMYINDELVSSISNKFNNYGLLFKCLESTIFILSILTIVIGFYPDYLITVLRYFSR